MSEIVDLLSYVAARREEVRAAFTPLCFQSSRTVERASASALENRIRRSIRAGASALVSLRCPSPEECALLVEACEALAESRTGGTFHRELAERLKRASIMRVPLKEHDRAHLIAIDAAETGAAAYHRDTINRLISADVVHAFDALRFVVAFREGTGATASIVDQIDDALTARTPRPEMLWPERDLPHRKQPQASRTRAYA